MSRLPSSATPTAPPTWRVVSLTADPTPAFERGSDPMIDSVAGAMTFAIPTPSRTATPMMNQTLVVGVNVRNINSDVATINSPAPTTIFVPARSTSRARDRGEDHHRCRLGRGSRRLPAGRSPAPTAGTG